MESHGKYLDELICAIRESRLTSFDSTTNISENNLYNSISIHGTLEQDPKSLKVLLTLLNNFKDPSKKTYLKNDTIFSKTIQALDLLLQSRPFLFISKIPTQTTGEETTLGMKRIINDILQVAINNYDITHRIWYLRRKLGKWCKLMVNIYDNRHKLEVSEYILSLITTTEKNLSQVLGGNQPTEKFLFNLKKLYILCYWLCAPCDVFNNCLTLLDSSMGIDKWSFSFEKVIRFIMYLFGAVRVTSSEYQFIQLKFISLVADSLINHSKMQTDLSIDMFKFTIETMKQFLKSNFGILPLNDIMAKAILRVYSLCIKNEIEGKKRFSPDLLSIFIDIFAFNRWLDFTKLIYSEKHPEILQNKITIKAILLVHFDSRRRSKPDEVLTFDDKYRMWTYAETAEPLLDIILQPFPDDYKQLEKLRKVILYQFQTKSKITVLKYELEKLDPGIISDINSDLEKLYERIEKNILLCINTKSTSKLVSWTRILGRLACLESRSLTENATLFDLDHCVTCDNNDSGPSISKIDPGRPDITKCKSYDILSRLLICGTDVDEFSEGLLAGILLALQRIIIHYQPPKLYNDKPENLSSFFELIKKCFSNHSRYLRLVSVRIIPLLNITNLGDKKDENTKILIKLLQSTVDPVTTETVIMSWIGLIQTIDGELFDFLLTKLMYIFNSDNYTVHSMITFQIQNLARNYGKSPYKLIAPILPVLLEQLGKNLVQRKASFQRLCDLLEYPGGTLLQMYQHYIVPVAVIHYETDSFGEIARIMCDGETESLRQKQEELLTDNCRQIFALALVKHSFFSLDILEKLFYNRVPDFDKEYVTNELKDYRTLAEIPKLYKYDETEEDNDQSNEYNVLYALRYLVTNFDVDKRRGAAYKDGKNWTPKREERFQENLQSYILGIFQVFSNNIHDLDGRTPYYEKRRVVNGIIFLIKNASKNAIISSLAQISICLQTSLEIKEIRLCSLQAWKMLIKRLNDGELSTIIDGFISFILQKWSTFEQDLQKVIYEILNIIIEEKMKLITEIKPYITFALNRKTELALVDKNDIFARMVRKTRGLTDFISIFSNNLKSNNKYVILQNLEDIEAFLESHQKDSKDNIFGKQSHGKDIALLLSSLLDTSHRFRTADYSLCEKCTRCISMIGVLDATKHSLKNLIKRNDVYFFNDDTQVVNFLIWIINDVLVSSFWQSENPRTQLFIAFVMQESLKYCGLDSEKWNIEQAQMFPREYSLWKKFNTIAQTTLSPLMSSLYSSKPSGDYMSIPYPNFNPKVKYDVWISTLVLDLLKTGTDEGHPLHVFASLIREDEVHLSNLLLPYIVVDIITKAEPRTKYVNLMESLICEFRFIFEYEINDLNTLQGETLKMAYETIFDVFEYCKKWITSFKRDYSEKNGTSTISGAKTVRMLKRLDDFLSSITPHLLAQRSLATSSYERSVLYLEECYRLSESEKLQSLGLVKDLQDIYEKIGDIDSIDGMLKTFTSSNLESKIKELQYSSNWKMAQDCFEVLSDYKLDSPTTTKMLRSMNDHQLNLQVINSTNLMLPENLLILDDDKSEWYSMGLESANVLGDINTLTNWITKVESLQKAPDHNVLLQYNIAKALYCVYINDTKMIEEYVNRCFRLVGTYFTTFSNSTSIVKQQDILMKLHGLYDLLLLSTEVDQYQYGNRVDILDFRLNRIGADFKSNHYLMSLRKSYDLLRNKDYTKEDLPQTYIKIAQLARDNSRLDIASDSLMKCLPFNHPQVELEFAEILWKKGENDRALKLVREIHQRYEEHKKVGVRDAAAVLLKYSEWLDLSNNSASSKIIEQYKKIFKLDPNWDEPYYSMGLYYSRLLERKKEEGYITTGTLEYQSISYFLMAFERNTNKVRENLPKVVTFWLDITANVSTSQSNNGNNSHIMQRTANDICKVIQSACERCPSYIWYSVLTQLLSRLLHPYEQSSQLIKQILYKLAIDYPEHILWYIAVLSNSKSDERKQVGRQLIRTIRNGNPTHSTLMGSAELLTKELINVCVFDTTKIRRSNKTIDKDFGFDMSCAPTMMTVPVHINLEMISPTSSRSMRSEYKPFRNIVNIQKFGHSYKVFTSMRKPKKLNVIGSDGKIYGIMCKQEDVRQDNQYMQFATTMDFLLNRDVESSKRNLGITTYSVLSLREDCGLLEIVPNVVTLRSIYANKYESLGGSGLRQIHNQWQETDVIGRHKLIKRQMVRFKPILFEWFLDTFPDPVNWFNARNRFARSYAVMAMVGHILGLGDRHCENILLDVETGEVLHVDFDCLFERGKDLPVPEIVPFRLTQNISDALGIIGTEGTFKKSSEVTLSLMRQNEVSLVNVIETIIYDRSSDRRLHASLKVLRNKIRGIDPRDGLVLSVPGQVEALIQEATSESNLCSMYIGWLPFW